MQTMNTVWRESTEHRAWLQEQAESLFRFYQAKSINPRGGFFELGDDGAPLIDVRQLHATSRIIHCFAIAHLLKRPGADDIIDHGMNYLWKAHRDGQYGGYVWSLNDDGIVDGSKQGYGHAFVLLAASSAKVAGHPLADKILADVSEVLGTRFWEPSFGAQKEEFARDWGIISDYRGQNSNMHLTEALMAAFEATGETVYLKKAESIAELIIARHAAALGYRVAEHFDAQWNVDLNYRGSDMFRPSGTTPGHWLEWSRLLLQLWELGGHKLDWLPDASEQLFRSSNKYGWDERKGGYFYTLDWNNTPVLRQKLWWPASEGIGAAAWLAAHRKDSHFEDWYQRIWEFTDKYFIDHKRGGWHQALGEDLMPTKGFSDGKPDLYHALQACLIPLYPAKGSLTKVISGSR